MILFYFHYNKFKIYSLIWVLVNVIKKSIIFFNNGVSNMSNNFSDAKKVQLSDKLVKA